MDTKLFDELTLDEKVIKTKKKYATGDFARILKKIWRQFKEGSPEYKEAQTMADNCKSDTLCNL